jgi:hypothetical protein
LLLLLLRLPQTWLPSCTKPEIADRQALKVTALLTLQHCKLNKQLQLIMTWRALCTADTSTHCMLACCGS